MWMNECDIRSAVTRMDQRTPWHLRRSALFLRSFCELINGISDGWPYWSYGTRCSEDLQRIVDDAQWPARPRASVKEAAKARAKVFRFLRRCRQTKDRAEVKEWLERWS